MIHSKDTQISLVDNARVEKKNLNRDVPKSFL